MEGGKFNWFCIAEALYHCCFREGEVVVFERDCSGYPVKCVLSVSPICKVGSCLWYLFRLFGLGDDDNAEEMEKLKAKKKEEAGGKKKKEVINKSSLVIEVKPASKQIFCLPFYQSLFSPSVSLYLYCASLPAYPLRLSIFMHSLVRVVILFLLSPS